MIKNFWTKLKEKNTNDKIVYIFIYASIALFLIFLVQFFLYWFLVTPNNPLNVPLFLQEPFDAFMDFFNVNGFVLNNDPYVDGQSSYPPLVLLIAKFFSLFANYNDSAIAARKTLGGIFSIILFFLIVIISLYLLLKKYIKDKNAEKKTTILFTIIFFFSAPMLYVTQRGNYLIFALLFVAVFFVFKDSPKKILRELSYVSLAAAVGIKLYPAIFAILLLREKKIFAVVKTAFYSILFLTIPFIFFKGGFSNISAFILNLTDFSKAAASVMVNGENYIQSVSNNFSITNTLLVVFNFIFKFNFNTPPEWIDIVAKIITLVFALIIVFVAFFSAKQWKAIAACSLATMILVNPSFAYTAIFLLLPCVVFLLDRTKTKKDWLYLALFLIIFSPIQYGYVIPQYTVGLRYGVTAANFVQAISLLIFVIALAIDAAKDLRQSIKAKKQKSLNKTTIELSV